MIWNYRIVRYRDGTGFGLHEVYYDKRGRLEMMTADAVSFGCDIDEGPEGVRSSLEMALADVTRQPVFDEPEAWPNDKLDGSSSRSRVTSEQLTGPVRVAGDDA